MSAAKLDLYVEQGSTFSRTLLFKDSNGNPLDLTGQTFRGQIRTTTSDPNIFASFTCVLEEQDVNTGKVTISIPADVSSAWTLRTQGGPSRATQKFAYDIERVLTDETVERVLEGVLEVSPEVTK